MKKILFGAVLGIPAYKFLRSKWAKRTTRKLFVSGTRKITTHFVTIMVNNGMTESDLEDASRLLNRMTILLKEKV